MRPIDVYPVPRREERLIALSDPTHLTDHALFIRPEALLILSLLDGHHSIADIQDICVRQWNNGLASDQLYRFIALLDEHLFLDNERYLQTLRSVEQAFLTAPVRSPAHAGGAYPDRPSALTRQIEGFFRTPEGPGTTACDSEKFPVGLIAPHIDFHRGGSCYAWSYRELSGDDTADLFVILGIGHAGSRHPFVMSVKDFATPLGVVETDRSFVERVQAACPFNVFEDEFIHRNEHSIEFQVILLQHMLRHKTSFQIVPILCGSFHHLTQSGTLPSDDPHTGAFLNALRQAMVTSDRRVCVIAGVDLAHVGMRFGDQEPLTEAFMQEVRHADLRLLNHVERLDADGLFFEICRDQDRRRICGYPAIYTLLKVVDARESRLIKYDQATDTATQQAVTFAGMALR